jgi:hypothetical protein
MPFSVLQKQLIEILRQLLKASQVFYKYDKHNLKFSKLLYLSVGYGTLVTHITSMW